MATRGVRSPGTMLVWSEPFARTRLPWLFNLRTDPYEHASITSNTYWDWYFDRVYLLVPMQAYVGQFLQTVALVDSLMALGPGPGRQDVIDWALTSSSEAQSRFMAGSVAILARHHQAMPVTTIRVAGIVLGETADGAVVVPAAVDYVSWTERVANFAGRPDIAGAKAQRLWVAGKVSPRVRQELLARKWTIEEGVSIVPPASAGTRQGH